MAEMRRSCAYCHKTPVPDKRCAKCRATFYCDRTCQEADWPRHKVRCCEEKKYGCCGPEYSSGLRLVDTTVKTDVEQRLTQELLRAVPPVVDMEDVNRVVKTYATVLMEMRKNKLGEQLPLHEHLMRKFSDGIFTPPIQHNDVAVKKSAVHGLGLFATKEIPADCVVTFYPAHYLCQSGDVPDVSMMLGQSVAAQIQAYDPDYNYASDYQFALGDVVIIGHPALRDDTRLLGHLVNDPCGNVFAGLSAQELYSRGKAHFNDITRTNVQERANCHFVCDDMNCLVVVQTTRVVREDEELLALYSPHLWLSAQYSHQWPRQYPFLTQYCKFDKGCGDK